jgi:hypothetical protein
MRLAACSIAAAGLMPTMASAVSWNRFNDWSGSAPNPTIVLGAPTWKYESITAAPNSSLGSANPWFKQASTPMVWDPSWYGSGQGVFASGDDANPPIFRNHLTHNVVAGEYNKVPLIRWLRPSWVTDPAVGISGTLTVNWAGLVNQAQANIVDVVIGKTDSHGNSTAIWSRTTAKPSNNTVAESITFSVNLQSVALAPGESIFVSERAQTSYTPNGSWINLLDNLTINAVPAPGTAAIVMLAGVTALRRKR